jgi:antitoxin component YwqK of YwqJK toxin-antitoxin module
MKGKTVLFLGLGLVACKPMELDHLSLIKSGVTVQVGDTTVKAGVQDIFTDTKLNRTYFWFANGKINHSQGAYSGKLLHGQFKSYHSVSKKLFSMGTFNRGLKAGSWLSWYDNGNLRENAGFKNGLMDGLIVRYDSSGRPSDTLKYKNGLLKVRQTDTVGFYKRVKQFLKFRKK